MTRSTDQIAIEKTAVMLRDPKRRGHAMPWQRKPPSSVRRGGECGYKFYCDFCGKQQERLGTV